MSLGGQVGSLGTVYPTTHGHIEDFQRPAGVVVVGRSDSRAVAGQQVREVGEVSTEPAHTPCG